MPQVLLVDDRPENLGFVQDYLKTLGYTVEIALSGILALESMKELTPDVVFLDLEMPHMSGIEVLKLMRSTPALASIPVAVLSAHPLEDVEDECLLAGANHVLSKPIRLRLLREVIEDLTPQR